MVFGLVAHYIHMRLDAAQITYINVHYLLRLSQYRMVQFGEFCSPIVEAPCY